VNGLIKLSFQLFNKEELKSLKLENYQALQVLLTLLLIILEIGHIPKKVEKMIGTVWLFQLMEVMVYL